jgi:hypothetical protein
VGGGGGCNIRCFDQLKAAPQKKKIEIEYLEQLIVQMFAKESARPAIDIAKLKMWF